MNRRKFLAALAALPAAAIVLSTIFKGGPEWIVAVPQKPFKPYNPYEIPVGWVRECSQWDINHDETIWRYDVLAVDAAGGEHQFGVDAVAKRGRRPNAEFHRKFLERALTEQKLIAVAPGHGYFGLQLPLSHFHRSRYV